MYYSYEFIFKKPYIDAYGVPCDKEQSSFAEFCERMRDMQKGEVLKVKKGNWSDDSSDEE